MAAELAERLAFWQRQLRLQDWEITVEISDERQTRGRSACSDLNISCKESRVRIMDPESWPGPAERVGTWDVEYFLLHELIHLHLCAWRGTAEEDGTLEWQQKEGAIDLLAGALWRVEHGERR